MSARRIESGWPRRTPSTTVSPSVTRLTAALADLETADAACLLLNVVQGFTAREIAAMLEISPDAAKKRLTRAKQRLRDAYFAREQSPAKEVR